MHAHIHTCAHTHTHTHTPQLFAARPVLEEELCEDDLISSGPSSRRESISSTDIVQPTGDFDPYRRRSSTSDVTKFRQLVGIRVSEAHQESEDVPNGADMDEDNKNANNSVELQKVDAPPRAENHMGMRQRALQVQARSVDSRANSMIVNVAYDL